MSNVIAFGRTESWDSGWRGKQNATTIRLNGRVVGRIRGEANTATPGMMNYGVEFNPGENLPAISTSALTLAQVKARIRSALNGD